MTGVGAEVFILIPLGAWVAVLIHRLLKGAQGVAHRHRDMASPVSNRSLHVTPSSQKGKPDNA